MDVSPSKFEGVTALLEVMDGSPQWKPMDDMCFRAEAVECQRPGSTRGLFVVGCDLSP